ncbi:rhamnosyl/mannosyltransferase [Tepidimonas ignava]|uniref:Alpha-D-kanosaminyltransferase n=1 Tax=Tepidimonas ignava TaxID=114249 RepID=A0A4V2UVY0_9BURK|nr:glycosyltransferase [Tepidimonas ignava]TCS97517.1 rhamnosyl/mannosyltransferase [Tepidimonas ignava]TSE22090.1 Alpha-D-kanosaminyltransferase [Tepidimonas ignava]
MLSAHQRSAPPLDCGGDGAPVVLHVGKFIPPPAAGIELHTHTLLQALQPHIPVGLLAACSAVDPQAHQRLPYPVWAVPNLGRWDAVTVSPGVLSAGLRLMRQGRVRALHLHLPNPWADLLAVLAPRNLPIVASWHSDIVRQRNALRLYRPLQQAVLRRVQAVIVATPGHLASSTQLGAAVRKAHVVPMGIDAAQWQASLADRGTVEQLNRFAMGRPIIASVGRHVYYKGYPWLLQALAHMREPAVLVMAGHGPLTPALRRIAQQLGLAGRILWLTDASHAAVVAVLHTCHVFTLPSVEPAEAFGLASAEAMLCGKPTVVCTLGNGVDDLNRHGQTSLVVPPRDPAALAAALDTLCADAELRQRLGVAARQWVSTQFSVQAMRDGTLAVYKQILG